MCLYILSVLLVLGMLPVMLLAMLLAFVSPRWPVPRAA